MSAQQGDHLMCTEEGTVAASLPSKLNSGTRKISERRRMLLKAVAILASCALVATASTVAVLKQQQQPSSDAQRHPAPSSISSAAESLLPTWRSELISLRLAHERLAPCQSRFNGSLCRSAAIRSKAAIVSREGDRSPTVAPWTPVGSDATEGAFALTDGDSALQVLRPGLYHVTAQLVAQLLDQSSARTVECAVRINGRAAIAGRSLSASRPLTCLTVGLLRLQPGDRIRVTLLSLDSAPGRDKFRIEASRRGLTFLQVARIGL